MFLKILSPVKSPPSRQLIFHLLPTSQVQRLRAAGIGSILDYAVEADLVEETGGTISAAALDKVADNLQRAVELVAKVNPSGFAAMKVTAIADPGMLRRMATAISRTNA